jgi:hypothetical protein
MPGPPRLAGPPGALCSCVCPGWRPGRRSCAAAPGPPRCSAGPSRCSGRARCCSAACGPARGSGARRDPFGARYPNPAELRGEHPATVMEGYPAPILLIVRRDPVPAPFLGVAPLSVGVGAPVARAIRRKPYLAPARMPLPCAVRIERGLEIDCGSRSLRQDRRSGRFDPGDTAQNAKSRCDRQQRTRENASYEVTLRFTRLPPEPRPEEPVPSGRRFAPPADAKT